MRVSLVSVNSMKAPYCTFEKSITVEPAFSSGFIPHKCGRCEVAGSSDRRYTIVVVRWGQLPLWLLLQLVFNTKATATFSPVCL